MASIVKKQSATTSKKVNLHPLNVATDFDINKVVFENVKAITNKITNAVSHIVPIKYSDDKVGGKLAVVLRNCQVIKVNEPEDASNPSYGLFVAVNDPSFKTFSEQLLDKVHKTALDKFSEWCPDFVPSDENDVDAEKVAEVKNINSFMNVDDMNMGLSVNSKYTDISVSSKFEHENKNSENLSEKFPPGTFLDVCFELDRIKLNGTRRICTRVVKVVATEVGELTGSGGGFHLTPEDYDITKVNITNQIFKYDKGGQYFKVEYDGKPLKLRLNDVTGWLSSNADLPAYGDPSKRTNKELGKTAFTLRVDISKDKPELTKMLDDINAKLQAVLKKFANPKTPAKEKPEGFKFSNGEVIKRYKAIFDYSKADKEAISKGEEPKYGKSMTVKLYYKQSGKDVREQFGTNTGSPKFVDSETGETVYDPTSYCGRVSIKSIDMYIRHIWITPDSFPTNFTLNKVEFSSLNSRQTYDMTLDEVDAPNYDANPTKATTSKKSAPSSETQSSTVKTVSTVSTVNDEEEVEEDEVVDSDGDIVE